MEPRVVEKRLLPIGALTGNFFKGPLERPLFQ
jgi:hypothetical protein